MRSLRGFTLLEVMVALSICAMAGIAAMQVTGEHINHLSEIEQQSYASWVAENQLVEAMLDEAWPKKDNKKGKVDMAGVEWYWRQQVVKTASDDFVQLTMIVGRDSKYQDNLFQLTTYVSKPGGR